MPWLMGQRLRSGGSTDAIGTFQLQQNALVPLLAQTICYNIGLNYVKVVLRILILVLLPPADL